MEEIEVLVYKYSQKKKYFDNNINIFDEVIKIIVPTFTEEIIASIFISGFKEMKKDIADKILDIYEEKHPHNLSDFINKKMFLQKNIIYTYSSISDKLIIQNNDIKINEDNFDYNENRIIINEDINDNNINKNENYNIEKTKEIYIESIKSIIELEKLIDDFMNEDN